MNYKSISVYKIKYKICFKHGDLFPLQNGVTHVNGLAIENGDAVNGRACRYRNRRETKSADQSSDTESETTDSSELPRVTTRRAWSDYCTNKGRSSQSEEESAGE